MLAVLERGGQGNVVKVRKNDSDELFAMKILKRNADVKAKSRFHREIKAAKELHHPGIIRIFDHSQPEDEFQFYVMEFFDGAKTLKKIVDSENERYQGDVLSSLDAFDQIVKAVYACETHEPRIVHRDIKPDNILMLPDGTLKLLDFGICHLLDEPTLTSQDEGVAPRNYGAPECEAGGKGPIGPWSDLLSAAKVLWSLVTNRRAFAREKPIHEDRSMMAVFPGRKDTWHLQRIFEQTIQENPEDRWQSAQEAIDWVVHTRLLVQEGHLPIVAGRSQEGAHFGGPGNFFFDITLKGASKGTDRFLQELRRFPIIGEWGDERLPGERRRFAVRTTVKITNDEFLEMAVRSGVEIEHMGPPRTRQAIVVEGTLGGIETICNLLHKRLMIEDIAYFQFAETKFLINFESPEVDREILGGFAGYAGVRVEVGEMKSPPGN